MTAQDIPEQAITDAAERIVDRRIRASHWSGPGLEAHRAALMLDALADATAALEAGAPSIRADERQKVYDELGHDHFVIFTADGWTTEHSIECRLSGHMHECEIHAAIGAWAERSEPPASGRWKVTDWTGEGRDEPVLERAEPKP